MKRLVLILLLCLLNIPTSSLAEERNALFFGIWTQHYGGEKQNEGVENRLLGVEIDRWTFAYFDNSYNNDTVFAAYAFHTKKFYNEDFWVRGNAYAGLLYGYGDHIPINWNGISPAVYPTASIGWKNYSIETGLMPTFIWWAFKIEF